MKVTFVQMNFDYNLFLLLFQESEKKGNAEILDKGDIGSLVCLKNHKDKSEKSCKRKNETKNKIITL